LLSGYTDQEIKDLLPAELVRYTPSTLTDIDALLADIKETRSTGVSFDHQEHDIGISAIATAVRNPMGITQAVSIVAPTHRFDLRGEQYLAALRELRQAFDLPLGTVAAS
jgi:IclR family acetate operon transcriptional repressor